MYKELSDQAKKFYYDVRIEMSVRKRIREVETQVANGNYPHYDYTPDFFQ